MDTCLAILKEQVNTLKANYFNFMGSFTNMFEFSNYTMIKIKDDKINTLMNIKK